MGKLSLSIVCGAYDRFEALRGGAIQPEGIALDFVAGEADVQEMSLADYLRRRSAGACPYLAIPVFPLRSFGHGLIHVRPGTAELAGKRIGLARDRADLCLAILLLLQQAHGLDLGALRMVEDTEEQLAAMLRAGEIDAMLGAHSAAGTGIARLFPDHRAADRAAWQQSGIFPILTTLALRDDVHARHPWVAEALFKACEDAKRRCLEQMRFSGALRTMLPWLLDEIDEMDAVFGHDPWPYGLDANRKTLVALMQLLRQRGEIASDIDLDALFAPIVGWAE